MPTDSFSTDDQESIVTESEIPVTTSATEEAPLAEASEEAQPDEAPPERPEAETRKLTDSEMFEVQKAKLGLRYRQVEGLLNEGRMAMHNEIADLEKVKSPEDLDRAHYNMSEGVVSLCDILQRINCGLIDIQQKEESKIIKVGG